MKKEDVAIEIFNKFAQFTIADDVNYKKIKPDGMNLVLKYLVMNQDKEILSGDIANALELSTARIAVLLNKLERDNLVKRVPVESDLRKTKIVLTKEGIDKVDVKRQKVLKLINVIIDELGYEKLDDFIKTLEIIKKIVEKECE